MAVPAAPREAPAKRYLASTLDARARRLGQSLGRPVFAVLLAMVAGGIVIMITSPGSAGDRFNEAIVAYQTLFVGAFGNPQNLSFTLTSVTPLILAGLSVAIAFRAGLFNIGAAGQLAMGAMAAGVIAFEARTWPGWLLIPLMLVGAVLMGAIWGGIVGFLKAWRGAHEVVTTIMLNWIAFYFTDYLIDGPFQSPHTANQTDTLPSQATLPHISTFYNSTLGTFLPPIAQPQQYLVDVGFFFALLALLFYWFLTARTTFGYEIRVIGQNAKAARYAGIPIKRNILLTMAIAGGFSGLAGALQLMGQFPYQLIATTFSIQSTGFDAIGVALLGRSSAIGVLLGALLFGGLRQGGTAMQLIANVPGDLVYIIQALVLFSIAAEFLPAIQRSFARGLKLRNQPSLEPATIGGSMVVELPDKNSEESQGEAPAMSDNGDAPESEVVSEEGSAAPVEED